MDVSMTHSRFAVGYEKAALSVWLCTICARNRFFNLLERHPGIRIDREKRSVSVVAYADDVTVFLTSATDLQIIDAIRFFENASRASVNPNKSQALPIGRWKNFVTVHGIAYYPSVKILVVQFWSTPIRHRLADKPHWTSTHTSTGIFPPRPVSNTSNTIRSHIPIGQDLVRGADLPCPELDHPIFDRCCDVFSVERDHLPGTCCLPICT
jgi:hypothetical protein